MKRSHRIRPRYWKKKKIRWSFFVVAVVEETRPRSLGSEVEKCEIGCSARRWGKKAGWTHKPVEEYAMSSIDGSTRRMGVLDRGYANERLFPSKKISFSIETMTMMARMTIHRDHREQSRNHEIPQQHSERVRSLLSVVTVICARCSYSVDIFASLFFIDSMTRLINRFAQHPCQTCDFPIKLEQLKW